MGERQQHAGIDGQNNVVVQIEGDNNAVNLKGLAHLTLTRYLTRRRVESDVDLLSPYSRSIPLIGREAELQDLRAWLANEKPISIRVLTGRAGSGKTRLALELCEQMLGEGWDAGFLEGGELERFRGQQNLATWGWQRPTLIVSDYAAVHAERLHGWCQELADNQGDHNSPLRLLLLERNAETDSGWWQTAFGRGGFGARAVQRLLDPAEPISILPLSASGVRRKVIGETLKEAGSDQRPPEEGTDPAFDRQLAELTWGGEPLFLMMAALMARDIGMANVLSLRRTDLAFELARRELARIARIGETAGINPDFMEVMAAYVTLCRGLDAAQIRAAVLSEQAALGLPGAGDPGLVAKLLRQALPGAHHADPILPDMIGEAAIIVAFSSRYDDAGAAVLRAFDQASSQVAATVVHMAQDFAGQQATDGEEIRAPLEWLDVLIVRDSVSLDELWLVGVAIRDALGWSGSSISLAAHAARVFDAIASLLRPRVSGEDLLLQYQLLFAVSNLANGLAELGRRDDALSAAQEAHDIGRQLAARHPDLYLPGLATALNILASCLRSVGRHEEALATVEETVAIRRELAAKAPDAYRPDLAGSLINLGTYLSAVGQREEALAPAQEAVELFRCLANQAPANYQPDLAFALDSLANSLSEVGEREAALSPAQEAADLYRALAATAPDAYRPALARTVNNLAARLSEVGQREAALSTARQAVDLYRELAAKAPDAYRPEFAAALNNLAASMRGVGQREAALAPAQEAIDLYRELAAKAPDAHRPALASVLNNLAAFLSEVGQREAALAPAQEALAIHRELAAKAPDAYRPDLAAALNNMAAFISEVGRREEALSPAQEAVDLYRELAAKAPDAYRPALAMALANLANRLSEVGQREAAVATAHEAADLYRALAAKMPDAYRPDFATSLYNLAHHVSGVGQSQAALAPAQEAADLYRELAARTPDSYGPYLAESLVVLANCLDANGELDAALQRNVEAIEIYQPSFLAQPPALTHRMVPICQQYIERCARLGREPDVKLLQPIAEVLQWMSEPARHANRVGTTSK